MSSDDIGSEGALVVEHGACVFFLPAEPAGRDVVRDGSARSGSSAAELQHRLNALLRGEMTSFLQAKQYLQTAQRYLTAARRARAHDGGRLQAHLEAADNFHRRAQKCLGYARLCRERARTLSEEYRTPIAC